MVTSVYMVAMATLAPCLPKVPFFIGSYSTIKEPEGLCSAYISYHVDHLQNKILLLKRRQEMSAGQSPPSAFMQPQQPVNNSNISNHGNNGNSDNHHYHGNKTVWNTGILDNKGDRGNACHQHSHNVCCSSRKVPVIFALFFCNTSVNLTDCSKQPSLTQYKILWKSVWWELSCSTQRDGWTDGQTDRHGKLSLFATLWKHIKRADISIMTQISLILQDNALNCYNNNNNNNNNNRDTYII